MLKVGDKIRKGGESIAFAEVVGLVEKGTDKIVEVKE